MRFLACYCWMLWSAHIFAATNPPHIPLNQNLVAVDYFREGRQAGCGLRATGDTIDQISLNVLIDVTLKKSGEVLGIFKMTSKKVSMREGAPLLQDGKITYSSAGKIHKAWIRAGSGVQPISYKNGESWHGDSYMATMEFTSTMYLLAAIPQGEFMVGVNQNMANPDEIFEFNARINPNEAERLFVCMRNLRGEIERSKDKNQHSF